MIEILVAIGIIVVLAGLLFLALPAITGSAKFNSTKITLGSLQGMLTELDAKTKLSKPPAAWRWWGTGATSVTLDPSSGFDFWKIPARLTTWRDPDALDAPGVVSADGAGNVNRNGSRQVLNTQIVMSTLLGIPSNRAALEKIAADRYFTPDWVGGTDKAVTPGTDVVLMTNNEGTEPIHYLLGNKVQHGGTKYLCLQEHDATSPPTPGANWAVDNSAQTPILLDSWNNPIIFVPGTGLRVRTPDGATRYVNGDGTIPPEVKTTIVMSPEGKSGPDPGGSGNPKVLQTGRPFFASAGPDGDFAKGDDNLYSFEQ